MQPLPPVVTRGDVTRMVCGNWYGVCGWAAAAAGGLIASRSRRRPGTHLVHVCRTLHSHHMASTGDRHILSLSLWGGRPSIAGL